MNKLKSVIFTIIAVLLVVLPISSVYAKTTTTEATTEAEKVKIYIFYGDGCPHCEELHNFIDELESDKKYNTKFTVVDYEVWYNETNEQLMTKVAEKFGDTVSGVPYYIIGEKSFSGFSSESESEIKNLIDSYYGSDAYKDVVASVGTGENDNDEEETEEKNTNLVGIIILGIVAIIIIVVIISRNNTKEEVEDTVIEEIKEPEVKKENETKVEVKKKNIAKKSNSNTKAVKQSASTKKSTTKKVDEVKTEPKKTTAKKTTSEKTSAKKTTTSKTSAKKTTSTTASKTTKTDKK